MRNRFGNDQIRVVPILKARSMSGGPVKQEVYEDLKKSIIDGLKKGLRVPLDTVSSHPWNIDAVDRSLVFGQRDGRIHQVSVQRAEPEILTIGGKKIEAEKYVVQGDLERELLYDADGTWLQWRLKRDGKTIKITRE